MPVCLSLTLKTGTIYAAKLSKKCLFDDDENQEPMKDLDLQREVNNSYKNMN